MPRFTAFRHSYTVTIVILAAFTAGAVWWSTAGAADPKCYRIGFENSRPYQFVDEVGGPAGPAIELLKTAAERTGVCLEWVHAEEGPDRAFASGRIDLWPLVGKVGDRLERFYISRPWRKVRFWLVSQQNRPVDPSSDGKGLAIAVGTGNVARMLAGGRFPAAQVFESGGTGEALAAVCSGRADAAFAQDTAADQKLPVVPDCQNTALRFVPVPNVELGWGIGASRDTPGAVDAAQRLRSAISQLVADGTVATIYFRWFGNMSRETYVIDQVDNAESQLRNLFVAVGILVVLFVLLLLQTRRVHRAKAAAVEAFRVAQKASEAKSRFLSTMSHEIRTPLNGVLGMASLLEHTTLDTDQTEQVEVIRQSGEALLALIDDVLDFSKIEAGKLELEEIDFDLPALTEAVHQILAYQANRKGLRLKVSVSESVPRYIRGDPSRLRQVLLNLAGNAIKFTEDGSVVITCDLDAKASRDAIRIEVTDSGPGIPPQSEQLLFQPFHQGDASTTRRHGGTGLGLVISHRLVCKMGGEIGCRNNPTGGATFWVTLPLTPGRRDQDTVAPPSVQPQPDTAARRILVADDNDINRTVTVKMLERLGYAVDTASNGAEAVKLAARRLYPLILMDCRMPVVDGYEAVRRIRESEDDNERAVVIALTASAFAEDRQACIDAGMDDYLSKPIEIETLDEKIRNWLPFNVPTATR